jgi:hypothetical protein
MNGHRTKLGNRFRETIEIVEISTNSVFPMGCWLNALAAAGKASNQRRSLLEARANPHRQGTDISAFLPAVFVLEPGCVAGVS